MAYEDETEYGLLMPFVTVASKGGPHDDDSYVAGYAMGLLDVYLKIGRVAPGAPVREDSLAQADLLAMRYDYAMSVDGVVDGWASVTFTKN